MKLMCPYCANEVEPNSDNRTPDTHYEKECSHCGRIFGYMIEYFPSYSEYVLPCANGEEHDYKPMVGFPKEWYIGKFRCSYCGDEISKGGHYYPTPEQIGGSK